MNSAASIDLATGLVIVIVVSTVLDHFLGGVTTPVTFGAGLAGYFGIQGLLKL